MAFVIGMDIGYSGLKIAHGASDALAPTTILRPSGAGPKEFLPHRITGSENYVLTLVDGEPWAAATEHDRFQGYDRELHKDFTSTRAYTALANATLALSGQNTVDVLVTGLPVVHCTQANIGALTEKLTGKHRIAERREVEVRKTVVIPQPTGAYMDLLSSYDDPEFLAEARIVVIDPGFFSVDFVLIERGELRDKLSTSSTQAMSVLLATANRILMERYGTGPGVEAIEVALRNGKPYVLVSSNKEELKPLLTAAAQEVAPEALKALRTSMRTGQTNVDLVLLAGGGAAMYEPTARGLFPSARIITAEDPALANARGFWAYGINL